MFHKCALNVLDSLLATICIIITTIVILWAAGFEFVWTSFVLFFYPYCFVLLCQ